MKHLTDLTKEERHEAYKLAKQCFINDERPHTSVQINKPVNYMCEAISDAIKYLYGGWRDYVMWEEVARFLPEMVDIKPRKAVYGTAYWKASNKAIRIKKFDLIIEKTKP